MKISRNSANSQFCQYKIEHIKIHPYFDMLPIIRYFGPRRNQNENWNNLTSESAARDRSRRAKWAQQLREAALHAVFDLLHARLGPVHFRKMHFSKMHFSKILQIFGGLVLGCIKTNFCNKICVWQNFSSSTRFASFCTAAIAKFSQKIGLKNSDFREISAQKLQMSQNLQNDAKFQKFQLENLVDFEKCCKTELGMLPWIR